MPKVCVIPGDGIGPEVVNEALKVLDVVEAVYEPRIDLEILPYGADHYLETGETMPPGELERIATAMDAVFVGALGDPRVPSNVHVRDVIMGLRTHLDLYVNERPARLLDARLTPIKGKGPGDIDLVIMRENTEGLYVGMGGVFRHGMRDEVAIAEELHTRHGVERIIRHAFERGRALGGAMVTMADKANAVPAHMLWRRVFDEVGREYRDVPREAMYADAVAHELVRRPERFRVIVTNNMFGDLLSDLAAALVGGLGMAPSANRHPGRHALFEPVHGSVPQMKGTDSANPVAAILSMAMLLHHFGATDAAQGVHDAVRASVVGGVTTPDLGGVRGTRDVGDWIADRIRLAS
jgi:3-isopropylmalate dehydrogenase